MNTLLIASRDESVTVFSGICNCHLSAIIVRLALGLCAAIAVCACSGCKTLSRPKNQSVVQSRQLSVEGMDAMHRGEWEEAEKLFTQAIEQSETNQLARCCYAEALWRRDASAEAIRQMQEAVRLSGGDPNLRVRLGEMHLSQGALDAAAAQASEAIRQAPTLASSWALQADVLAARGQVTPALASYHRALSYQPHFPRVQLATAELHLKSRQPANAIAALNALADGYQPNTVPADVWKLQGMACKDLQRYDDANLALARAIEMGSDDPHVYVQLCESQWLAGDPGTARLTMREGLRRYPNLEAGQQLLAQLEHEATRKLARAQEDEARRLRR